MARRRNIIPKAPVARILVRAGAKRVSEEAAEVFAEVLIEVAKGISAKAIEISRHSGRKTIDNRDIKLAAEHYK